VAKPTIREDRKDFGGGLNVSANPDALNANELLVCTNARVEPYGGIMRRPGSVILNSSINTDLFYGITGLKQWGNGEIVVINADNGGQFYHLSSPYTAAATLVATPGGGIFAGHADFATFRDASPGAPLVLFIATGGGNVFKWTGSALTRLDGTNGVPQAQLVKAFGPRLFYNDLQNPKTLFWSKIGVGDDCRTGADTDGGSALTDTLSGDAICGLEPVASSLMICTNDSIARFTGTADDIQILQDSQGVSTEIGPSNEAALGKAYLKVEQVMFLHSDRGVYIATEGGTLPIGSKITSPDQTALRMSNLADRGGFPVLPILGHNFRRSEIFVAYVPLGASFTGRTHCLVYNYLRQCWYGPFIYPFSITTFATYEASDGVESIMCGCLDGCIRLLDDPAATAFDDGVTDFDADVEFAPFGLSAPQVQKSLQHVYLQVLGAHTFSVTATGDLGLSDDGALVT
jgi:hypothetical protein